MARGGLLLHCWARRTLSWGSRHCLLEESWGGTKPLWVKAKVELGIHRVSHEGIGIAAFTHRGRFSQVFDRVYSSKSGSPKKGKLMPLQERKMVDKFRLHVRGGEGGAGCTSFRKSRQARHGLADGGNGGRGGDVILVSSAAVWDFSNLQHHLNGTKGGAGTSKRKVGSRGMDKIVQVPVGTVVHLLKGSIPSLERLVPDEPSWEEWEEAASAEEDHKQLMDTSLHPTKEFSIREGGCQYHGSLSDEDNEDGEGALNSSPPQIVVSQCVEPLDYKSDKLDKADSEDERTDEEEEDSEEHVKGQVYMQSSVAEFVSVGQSLIVACGGEGGKGNAAMARGRGAEKSLPSLEHEPGAPGSEAGLILELKTIADVGLVGAPNAGKSTLLGSLSRAKPVTGHYKFTTLRPNIGKLEFEDFYSFTVADIPGLIEGAHENRGLGHAFLRHIERTKVLAYVVDLSAGIGENPGPRPWEQIQELVFELEQYQKGLSNRPSLVVANKIDEDGAMEALEELRRRFSDMEIYPVCAVLEEGVDSLKEGLRKVVETSQLDSCPLSQPREL